MYNRNIIYMYIYYIYIDIIHRYHSFKQYHAFRNNGLQYVNADLLSLIGRPGLHLLCQVLYEGYSMCTVSP